jgi:hypothetical protein
MQRLRPWIAAVTIAVAALGTAACNSDPEDADQVEQQIDDMEEEVRENTP